MANFLDPNSDRTQYREPRNCASRLAMIRSGAAVVEFAICMPLLMLLIFASLEGANMLFMRQAAVQAAYESVKSVVKTNGSLAAAKALGNEVLASRNISLKSLEFKPSDVEAAAPGTPIAVTVKVDGDSRSVVGISPFRGLEITAQATMIKE